MCSAKQRVAEGVARAKAQPPVSGVPRGPGAMRSTTNPQRSGAFGKLIKAR